MTFAEYKQNLIDKIKNGEIEVPYRKGFWLSTGNTEIKRAIIANLTHKLKK